ncbi:uncharacterized protein ACMZJ9_019982 [Mantella aurantiaca]
MENETERLGRRLSEKEHCELRMLYEYFRDDIVYVLESLPTLSFLSESRNHMRLDTEHYRTMEKQRGTANFAQNLVRDILDMSKEEVIGFFKTLCALQRDHPHPNLLGVINEINSADQSDVLLLAQIIQDTVEPALPPEHKEIWGHHKKHLLDKTHTLVENKPPGTTRKPQGFPISERYLDLIVVSTHQFKQRSQHEILYTGGQHEHYLQKAQNGLERISIHKLFRRCHRSEGVPHAVLVSGVPGVGKTTMMQKFVFDWVNGKLYQRFHFVFFFKFRDLNMHENVTTLEEMVLKEYPYLENHLGDILQNPEHLLFIFDGLDESSHLVDFKLSQLCRLTRQRVQLGVIVVSLVKASLLQGCSVLMTSRPAKLADINTGDFQRLSEIVGFFPAERKKYFFNFFDNPELAVKAFRYVRENGTLYTFCYIPTYCWIVCTVISMSLGDKSKDLDQLMASLPKTVTQLFVTFVSNLLANHSQIVSKDQAQEALKSMGKMAEYGVMNHVLTFERRDLNSFHLDPHEHLLSSFMIESKQSSYVTYSFFHLTIQEFFAALAHFIDYSAETLRDSIEKAWSCEDNRGELFLRFLVGLSHAATSSLLADYFKKDAGEPSKQVITWLSGMISSFQAAEGSDDKRKLLNIFAYLYESQNDGLVSHLLTSMTSLDFSEFHLAPLDCTVLMFILKISKNTESLDLDSSFVQREGLERLGSVLHTVKDLRLSNNDLKDADMEIIHDILLNPDCKIQKLSLRKNALSDTCCPLLSRAISRNKTLRELDLSRNNVAGPHFGELLTAISSCSITHLYLQQVKLTDDYAGHLLVLCNSENLTHLNLGLNYLTDASAGCIATLRQNSRNLQQIRIEINDFTGEVEENFRKMHIKKKSNEDVIVSEGDGRIPDINSSTEKIMKSQRTSGSLDDITRFRRQLSAYDDPSLRRIHEYYRDDLAYILENMDTRTILRELKKQKVINTEPWTSLFIFSRYQVYTSMGDHLVEQILLDELGHSLTPELTDIQKKHKQHLMERTETLVEHRPPGTTLEPQRFLINERYVNLIVVSTDQFRPRSQNELIQTGVKHEECLKETQTGLEHISPNRLFCWNYKSRCVPHAVMVSGVPGIGKTTLMQKFVNDWVTGKHYQRFAFIFSFRFRDLNRLGEVSLEEIILHQYPYLKSQIGNILQHPERLLFIFDGLDESIHQMDFRSKTLYAHRTNFGEIVVSLVRGSLLQGCSVLITSRPTRLASVDTGVFQRIAEIMGFLHGDRRIFFNNFFGNEELSEKAFHYVQENDTLYTFCYIPSYCWIICTVLSMCFKAQPTITDQLMESLPKTVTQLFVTFVSNILTNHSQNIDGDHPARDLLTTIGRMAEHGVMNHMIVFDERHLKSFSVRNDKHLFSSFLMESGQPPDVDYTFLHLTLQEFFAAFVHIINYDPDRLQETLDKAESYEDGRAELLLRFLCGLSDFSTRSMLKSHAGELSTQAARHVITWIQKKNTNQRSDESTEDKKRELLNVFYYLHESRNKFLVSQCIESNKVDLSRVPLSPLDCSVLTFILQSLQSCRETEEVNLDSCNIQSEGLRKLVPALHAIQKISLMSNLLTDGSCPHLASVIRDNQTLRTLDLSDNNLEGSHFRDLMAALTTSRIEELQLRDNHLTDISCPHLASGIRDNQTLKTLHLSKNNLKGPHFRDLMKALTTSRIEELHLMNNHLTDRSSLHLASGIRDNQTLRKLNLCGNNLEGRHFSDLMEALTTSQIEELHLKNNLLTDRSCPHLASGIRDNQTLRILELSENNLEGPHFRDLMEALTTSRIEELHLFRNHLTDISCPHLASGIRDNQTLRKLDLSDNNLEGPHFRDLMEALTTSRIEELQLSDNHLANISCPHLASGIRDNQTLRKLDLSDNNLEGPRFRDLMAALTTSRIEELHLRKTHLTDISCPHLASGIRNNQTLRTLDVSHNNLAGRQFRDLMTALTTSRIEELQIAGDFSTEECKRQLKKLKSLRPAMKVTT